MSTTETPQESEVVRSEIGRLSKVNRGAEDDRGFERPTKCYSSGSDGNRHAMIIDVDVPLLHEQCHATSGANSTGDSFITF
jgi:hypothetical protein